MSATVFVGEVCRWWNPASKSGVILQADGRLWHRHGARGRPVVVRTQVGYEEAAAYVGTLAGDWKKRGGGGAKERPRPKTAKRKAFLEPGEHSAWEERKRGVSPRLPPELEAIHEARILAEQVRVEADLRRLGQLGPGHDSANGGGQVMSLTRLDCEGPQWLIIGIRTDGDRLVLGQAVTWEQADAHRQHFARQLEGYRAIVCERVGAESDREEVESA